MIGEAIGPYRVLDKLGEGGMGEVYRAHDTKLKRDVALKVLPAHFTEDADRMARFQREAEVLAALNHPHIAHIHGVEEFGGAPALVMELVDGEDLRQRIARSAVPLDDALEIARQIAEALEAAHERGIVHRDLKPANVRIRPDGTVKVLDFGLAKLIEQGSGIGDQGSRDYADSLTGSPTVTSPAMTVRGTILGTAAYMAPEQAKGKAVDKRADIWAFGCVLFEMISARRPFAGDSVTDVIAAVIKDPPDWQALPPATPEAVRRLLARCLEKQARRRLHDVADARIEIESLIDSPDDGRVVAAPAGHRSGARREAIAWTATGTAIAIAAWLGLTARSSAPSSSASIERLSLVHRVEGGAVFGAPQISPDGRRVVYSAEDKDGPVRLWLRSLDGFEATPMPGTEDFRGFSSFWSPDSKSIAFIAGGKLKRISADGGPVQSIADATSLTGGAWSQDGVILFTADEASGLVQIPEGGGTPKQVTTLPTDAVWAHMWPSFLPDGRRFIFTVRAFNRSFEATDAGIFLGSLDDPRIHRLLPDVSSAVYVEPGYILFARDGILTAAPFDTASGRITGEAVSLQEKVTLETGSYNAAFSVSSSGAIALRQALPFEDLIQGRWVDRHGAFLGNAGDARTSSSGAASRSGRFVAFGITNPRTGNGDVWVADADGANLRPLAASPEWEGLPSWSRDETRVAYTVTSERAAGIKIRDLNGGEPVTLIEAAGQTFVQPLSWSPHDSHLLFLRRETSGKQGDLYVWSFAERAANAFIASSRDEWVGLFSPDGKWVAYTAGDFNGSAELWVTSFPAHAERRRLATDVTPLSWGAGGREIIGINSAGKVIAIPVTIGAAGVIAGTPSILIDEPTTFGPRIAPIADHSRFLVGARLDPEKGVAEIRLIRGLLNRLRPDGATR